MRKKRLISPKLLNGNNTTWSKLENGNNTTLAKPGLRPEMILAGPTARKSNFDTNGDLGLNSLN